MRIKLYLILIIFLAFVLRVYGINWDQGFHLQPDERAIVMFTTPLAFPTSIQELFSPEGPWNPHFFAYGNFPLYLLKITGDSLSVFNPLFSTYSQINLLGRFISALADLGTILMVFLIGKKLFDKKIALIGSFFYAISVLPIQSAHFYIVDPLLTFFVILTLYQLLLFYEKPTRKKSFFLGCFFGLSLATKSSALVLLSSIGIALIFDFLLIFLRNPHRPSAWFPHLPKVIKTLLTDGVIIVVATFIAFLIFEPYAFLDFKNFWLQTKQQYQMTHDAFTFPYTLQYVGKIPYFYEMKNIFLWGQGPLLAFFSFLGLFYISFGLIRKKGGHQWSKRLIILVFFWVYFLMVGRFAIGFMRYMLPIYPFLCLFAASFLFVINLYLTAKFKSKIIFFIFYFLFFILITVWPLSFINIYTKPNTRVTASEWINKNIAPSSTLTVEHWDDTLPLFGQQNYRTITLPLYDPDTSQKWEMINLQLQKTNYIIIASNRLYMPLQKLTDCQSLPEGKCYPLTAKYYKELFNGLLGFEKVAEFVAHPQFSIFNFQFSIDDSSADESFTVYDHPKVMIFKKILDRKSS